MKSAAKTDLLWRFPRIFYCRQIVIDSWRSLARSAALEVSSAITLLEDHRPQHCHDHLPSSALRSSGDRWGWTGPETAVFRPFGGFPVRPRVGRVFPLRVPFGSPRLLNGTGSFFYTNERYAKFVVFLLASGPGGSLHIPGSLLS